MKTSIDLKSALIGVGIGVVAMLAIGAANDDSSRQTGRFQCASGAYMLIVDTATGKAWCLQPGTVSVTGNPPGFFEPKIEK